MIENYYEGHKYKGKINKYKQSALYPVIYEQI